LTGTHFFTALGTGNVSSCGIGSDAPGANAAFLYCWGRVASRNIGPQPTRLLNEAATSVAVGYEHVCGIQQGEIWCLGSNESGQLGVTGMVESTTPVRVTLQ
jgi:hypothetical protein